MTVLAHFFLNPIPTELPLPMEILSGILTWETFNLDLNIHHKVNSYARLWLREILLQSRESSLLNG